MKDLNLGSKVTESTKGEDYSSENNQRQLAELSNLPDAMLKHIIDHDSKEALSSNICTVNKRFLGLVRKQLNDQFWISDSKEEDLSIKKFMKCKQISNLIKNIVLEDENETYSSFVKEKLAYRMENLEGATVHYQTSVNNDTEDILKFSKFAKNLNGIVLGDSLTTKQESVIALLNVPSNLEVACIDSFPLMTENIRSLLSKCFDLVRFEILGKDEMNDELVDIIVNQCRNLKTLRLSECKNITNLALRFIEEKANSLKNLSLNGNDQFTEDDISIITKTKGWKYLTLSGITSVSDKNLEEVAKNSNTIQTLNIRDCNKISDNGISLITKNCNFLHKIDILGCGLVSTKGLSSVVNECKELTHFDFSNVPVSTITLITLTSKHFNLKALCLLTVNGVTDDVLKNLGMKCRNLNELTLSSCDKITDLGMADLTQGANDLKVLWIAGCYRISNTTIQNIIKYLRNIFDLNLSNLTLVTEDAVKSLVEETKIRQLICYFCTELSPEFLDNLTKSSKSLLKVKYRKL